MRNDLARLEQLQQLAVLDTSAERVYDDLTRLLSQGLGVPIAMVNLLDAERDWFKACVGLPNRESPSATSFCEIFFHDAADWIVVEDTTLDPRFANHPFVMGVPHIRFYAAARLAVNGQTIGTLCAYDLVPRHPRAEQLTELQGLAAAAMHLLARRTTAS